MHFQSLVSALGASSADAVDNANAAGIRYNQPCAIGAKEEFHGVRLAHERAARRVVRAVDLRVTIDAAAGEQKRARRAAARQSLRRVDDRGMARALVARLAEKRRPNLEERRLRRAVRIVAVAAVLA